MQAVPTSRAPAIVSPAQSRFVWLSPVVCGLIFAALLMLGAASHLSYLTNNCPLNLSGDEAQYWDWSRQLDLSYYSKGPLVAYIIRASCAMLGDTMPAVRIPAMLLAIGTSILTYWLIVKLFRSDRLALGSALLSHCVPVFIAGSILMTIDPPLFFCWAAATCLAVKAVFDNRKWAWPLLGVAVGIGFLAKYAMLLWFVCFALFLLIDQPSRRYWRSPWLWLSALIALAFTTPVLVWNAQHEWISLLHVRRQTGTGLRISNPFEMLGGQIAIVGPFIFVILVGAIAYVLGREGKSDPKRRALLFLLTIGLSFFVICFADSFFTKVQPNWPAPAYFSLMILAGYFLSRRLWGLHKWWWRGNVALAAVLGLILGPIAHDFSIVYPLLDRNLPRINQFLSSTFHMKNPKTLAQLDPTYKLRGAPELGEYVGQQVKTLAPGAFILADDYQTTALLAFYTPGQPRTYYWGSYKRLDPARHSQYDIWPDRSLEPDKTALLGRDAISVGPMFPELRSAFASVQQLPELPIRVNGYYLRSFELWRCTGFKGLPRPQTSRY